MSNRKSSTSTRSRSTKAAGKSQPTSRPPTQPKKGGDLVIIQSVPRQPGILGTFAGTAAGVAAGTVIGDKLTEKSESDSSASPPAAGAMPSGPCQYEEQQLLVCAQNQSELQICESFKHAWMDCKRKYNLT